MEYEISWGGDPEDLTVTTSGKVTVEELDEWVQTVLADPRYRPGLRILLDHRRADWAHLTSDDLVRRIDLVVRDAGRLGQQRVAWVVSKKVDFGLGRMMQELEDGRTELVLRAFDDIEKARAWLRESG